MHPGHAAAMMAAGLNGAVAAPLPLEAEERPAKRPRTGNRMVRGLCRPKFVFLIDTLRIGKYIVDLVQNSEKPCTLVLLVW